jgi:hypothetical protein
MTEALNRLIPLLEKDVVATLGEQFRQVVRGAVMYRDYQGDADGYDDWVVESVQEEVQGKIHRHDLASVSAAWPTPALVSREQIEAAKKLRESAKDVPRSY